MTTLTIMRVCIFLFVCVGGVLAYKHVIFMHGILSGPWEFDKFVKQLKIDHPGTNTTQIDEFDDVESLVTMWDQVNKIQIKVKQIMAENPQGIHLVCFSQGGLICRALLSALQHNVDTFIALSCPLAGQYGDSEYLKYLFPNFLKSNIYRLFYTTEGQKVSIANYWYDPHHLDDYRKFSNFLAVLNNDTFNSQSEVFKANFIRLKRMVLVGGPDDGVITPWQSSHFGMYNSSEVPLPMKDQKWFQNDSFGLQTLYKRGAIKQFTFPGIQHTHWHSDMEIYKKCVLPYLI